MALRKWMVRGLVFGALGGMVAALLLYQAWTNPAATRQKVVRQLEKAFTGAHVSLDSARLRLLGGISFNDLRLARRDDLDRVDFLYAPSGVIYHDKERLANGDLAVRKIEVSRLRLRVVRARDGRWNVADVLGPVNLNERVPTLVIQQATLVFEDRAASTAAPLLEIKDASFTVVNDPLPILVVEGSGQTDAAGPVRLSARIQRASGDLDLTLDAPAVPVGPSLVQRVAALAPEAAAHVQNLRGDARVTAALSRRAAAPQPLSYDVTCTLTKGAFSHPGLTLPLEELEATARCVNGVLPLARFTARSGPTKFDVTLRDLTLPRGPREDGEWPGLDELVREVDARVEHVAVSDALFDHLSDHLKDLKPFNEEYRPRGFLSVTHSFRQLGGGQWHKHWLVNAEDMEATYHLFPYTVERITGAIAVDYGNDLTPLVKLDLLGYSRDRPITLKGTVHAAKRDSGVEIDIAADNMPLDEKLFKALPPECQRLAAQFLPDKSRKPGADFRPVGLGDFKVTLRRTRGVPVLNKRYLVTFHDAALKYDIFPYPLEHVSGVLDVQPDHWECRDFRGTHNGGEFSFSGRSYPTPGPRTGPGEPPAQVRVDIAGRNILLDDADFLGALAPRPALHQTWGALKLAGRMNFDATVIDVPDQPQDIDVSVAIRGCRMRPAFFDYTLDELGGTFRYAHERVYLNDVKARHGSAGLSLERGQVILVPGGGFQVRLDNLRGTTLAADGDLLHALPLGLRQGLEGLHLRTPVNLATALVVDVPSDPGKDALVWWDGWATLREAGLLSGVELSDVTGVVTCCGRYNGRQLEGVVGHVGLDQLTVLKQPAQNLHTRFEVRPDSPQVLRFYDLNAELFGGKVGGEGRVEFGPTLRYDATVKALNVRLEDFGRHNFGRDADMTGPAMAALHVIGEGTDLGGLKGNGRVFVRDAKLYKLPRLLDLVKAFGLRLPDGTAFEEASATFALDGPQVRFDQLDLLGNAVSLRGKGTTDLDGGNLNLDFHTDWARFGDVLGNGPLADIPRAVSDQLFKIKVRGRVGDVRFEKEFVPAVSEPLKRVMGTEKKGE